jgi:hypothetical protein
MTKIALDANALAALATTESGVVAVTDASGNVVGFYAPVKQEYAEHYAELAARASVAYSEGRRPLTTAEVIKHLESREKKQ